MPISRRIARTEAFNPNAVLPYELRIKDLELAMQDVYDFFHDVNSGLVHRGRESADYESIGCIGLGRATRNIQVCSLPKRGMALTARSKYVASRSIPTLS